MMILVGAFDGNMYFDSFVVDGYESKTQLIHELKKNFNNWSAVIDLFNYLDSDGQGTRNPFTLSLNPSQDFIEHSNSRYDSSDDVIGFRKSADYAYNGAIIWKNGSWWIYNKFGRTLRKVK